MYYILQKNVRANCKNNKQKAEGLVNRGKYRVGAISCVTLRYRFIDDRTVMVFGGLVPGVVLL